MFGKLEATLKGHWGLPDLVQATAKHQEGLRSRGLGEVLIGILSECTPDWVGSLERQQERTPVKDENATPKGGGDEGPLYVGQLSSVMLAATVRHLSKQSPEQVILAQSLSLVRRKAFPLSSFRWLACTVYITLKVRRGS